MYPHLLQKLMTALMTIPHFHLWSIIILIIITLCSWILHRIWHKHFELDNAVVVTAKDCSMIVSRFFFSISKLSLALNLPSHKILTLRSWARCGCLYPGCNHRRTQRLVRNPAPVPACPLKGSNYHHQLHSDQPAETQTMDVYLKGALPCYLGPL